MNSCVTALCSLLIAVLLSGPAFAQSTPIIAMDKVMTAEELKAAGLDTLTPAQRSALDQWLSEYTVKLIQLAQRPDKPAPSASLGAGTAAPTYTGASAGHWIRSKANNGDMITLEDGSIWEINPIDRIDTVLWLPITNITVLKASQPVGDYQYLLVNKDDGEKALAKFLGK
jgi:hypothetical protein